MGTTLTGTTPQDTYDSLIKVTDNGPLSSTAKYLSDGFGNDSALALSTSAVGIGLTSPSQKLEVQNGASAAAVKVSNSGGGYAQLAISSNATSVAELSFTNSLSLTGGNVGIGTSTPSSPLTVYKATSPDVDIQNSSALHRITGDAGSLLIRADYGNTAANTHIQFSLDGTEVGRFTPNGLTFNGDTAAANALDDYEEGTFTPTIIGSTTAGTATYGGGQAGTYTKIGNVVYFQIYLGYSGGTGTGDLRIAGLPFTIPASDLPSFTFGVFLNVALTALNVPIAGGIGSTNQIYINQIPTGGGSQTSVPYDDSAVIQISGFYRV